MKIIDNLARDLIEEKVSGRIVEIVTNNPHAILCLSTGSTMPGIYQKVIKKSKNVDWSHVKTFNLDEYVGVKSKSILSYRYYMKQHLFHGININRDNTFFPFKKNYLNYDALIKSLGGLDFALLGVGVNGHIAFNEPGSSIDTVTRIISLDQSTIEVNAKLLKDKSMQPTHAYTMGIASILKAKEIFCIGFGKSKLNALKRLLDDKVTSEWPVTYLKKHNNVTIYTDQKLF